MPEAGDIFCLPLEIRLSFCRRDGDLSLSCWTAIIKGRHVAYAMPQSADAVPHYEEWYACNPRRRVDQSQTKNVKALRIFPVLL